jgi:hypothetical protein
MPLGAGKCRNGRCRNKEVFAANLKQSAQAGSETLPKS